MVGSEKGLVKFSLKQPTAVNRAEGSFFETVLTSRGITLYFKLRRSNSALYTPPQVLVSHLDHVLNHGSCKMTLDEHIYKQSDDNSVHLLKG